MLQPNGPVVVVLEKVDSYQAQIMAGLRAELTPRRVPLLLFVSETREGTAEAVDRIVTHEGARGLVLTGDSDPATTAELAALGADRALPVVHVGVAADGLTVRGDNRQGMRLIARHLVEECGARRIVAVRGHAHQQDSAEREAALRDGLAALGVDLPDELVLDGEFSRSRTFGVVRDLLNRGVEFDAVAAFNDRSAFGAVDALLAAGLRVPDDVAVTGFDDDEISALTRPSLTTVSQNLTEQGALAGRLLLEMIAGGEVSSTRVPVQLLRRETTGEPGAQRAPEDPLRTRLVALDTLLEVSRSIMDAPTVEALTERVGGHLAGLGIDRAFLVLRAEKPDERGIVALAYYDDVFEDVADEELFDLSRLLPEHLAHHLHHGTLARQPLVTGDSDLGYLLIDQGLGDHAVVSEALGMGLSRALENIRTSIRLARQNDELEALVAERTRQLEAEVAVRRRTEEELRNANAELRASLHVDGLTGIANRAAFEEALVTQWSGHSRSGQALSLIMMDVDHFKAYNDRYGHLPGDEALRVVAGCLQATTRRLGDVAARYGGEEFALLLPNTGADGALVVASRLRGLIARAAILHEDSPVQQRLTVSIGVASMYPDALGDAQELVAAADAALYDVKDAGRDGIACTRERPRITTPEQTAG